MVTNGQWLSLSAELDRLRMARDWTYRELAEAIEAKTHRGRKEDCWRRICMGLSRHPHQRTVSILEEFLDGRPVARKRRQAKATLSARRPVRRAS